MARTNDPSAATKKAWLTRHRAQEGGRKEVVQVRGDFADGAGIAKADMSKLTSIITHSLVGLSHTPHSYQRITERNRAEQSLTEAITKEAVKLLDLPETATDGVNGLVMALGSEMMVRGGGGGGPGGGLFLQVAKGRYNGNNGQIEMNSEQVARVAPEEAAAFTAKTLSHEIGHHALLSKISEAAAAEWLTLSQGGKKARLSKYARQDANEHFAEAFAAYSNVGAKGGGWKGEIERARLRKLEPKAYAFMVRLWKDKAMWRPVGQVVYVEKHRGW